MNQDDNTIDMNKPNTDMHRSDKLEALAAYHADDAPYNSVGIEVDAATWHQLRAENARLRAALEGIANTAMRPHKNLEYYQGFIVGLQLTAHEALEGDE